jgi:hypothetical protein
MQATSSTDRLGFSCPGDRRSSPPVCLFGRLISTAIFSYLGPISGVAGQDCVNPPPALWFSREFSHSETYSNRLIALCITLMDSLPSCMSFKAFNKLIILLITDRRESTTGKSWICPSRGSLVPDGWAKCTVVLGIYRIFHTGMPPMTTYSSPGPQVDVCISQRDGLDMFTMETLSMFLLRQRKSIFYALLIVACMLYSILHFEICRLMCLAHPHVSSRSDRQTHPPPPRHPWPAQRPNGMRVGWYRVSWSPELLVAHPLCTLLSTPFV